MREEIDFQAHRLILTNSKSLVLRDATWPTPWDLALSTGPKTLNFDYDSRMNDAIESIE